MGKEYYVYIMASKKDGVLYIGITSDLVKRIWEHKEGITKGFTGKYKIKKLVYFEIYNDPETAIKREKNMKAWKRSWKTEIIENNNPKWEDLYDTII